jgi:hypothetical protein
MGHWVRQLLAALYVTSSLAPVALGGSDLTQWVLPSNTELLADPVIIVGPISDMVSYPVMYRMCRMRSRMIRKIVFTVPFYHACGAQPLCLLDCYTVGL